MFCHPTPKVPWFVIRLLFLLTFFHSQASQGEQVGTGAEGERTQQGVLPTDQGSLQTRGEEQKLKKRLATPLDGGSRKLRSNETGEELESGGCYLEVRELFWYW